MCVAEQMKSGLPTNCCCDHTHMGCRMSHLRVAPIHMCECVWQNKSNQGCAQGLKCFKGSADQVLLQAYTCVLRYDKTRGFTQGATVTKVSPTTCCSGRTHVCCRIHQRTVAPRVSRGLADQILLGAYTCVWQNTGVQGCSQGSKAIATATASTHTCVAEKVN